MRTQFPVQTYEFWTELRPYDQVRLAIVGVAVVFACLGAGEAVYRILFLEFDGATDRLPIEALFGIIFATFATKLIMDLYRRRRERASRMQVIRARNERIRAAVLALDPLPIPGQHQAIRVIREQVEGIEWTLDDMMKI